MCSDERVVNEMGGKTRSDYRGSGLVTLNVEVDAMGSAPSPHVSTGLALCVLLAPNEQFLGQRVLEGNLQVDKVGIVRARYALEKSIILLVQVFNKPAVVTGLSFLSDGQSGAIRCRLLFLCRLPASCTTFRLFVPILRDCGNETFL